MIKYLGSKRSLLPQILMAIRGVEREMGPVRTVLDLFSGTARVGHALKGAGYQVIANDHNTYAATLARCYVQADAKGVLPRALSLIQEFNRLPGAPDYMTETFCVKSRYFHPKNGERIDAIRNAIAAKDLGPELEAVLLVSLMEAADRVDSTCGVQMAYLKSYAPRASNNLELRMPNVLPRASAGKGRAWQLDAQAAARLAARHFEIDVAYIDPPYNQHSYLGNYHVWESLVRWDKPVTYGVACKRVDVRERQSVYNRKSQCAEALRSLLASVKARTVILSFSNEGFLTPTDIEQALAIYAQPERGGIVQTLTHDYPRYIGAKIGIYNPQGKKVGKVSHTTNKEFLYIASRAVEVVGGVGARVAGETSLTVLNTAV